MQPTLAIGVDPAQPGTDRTVCTIVDPERAFAAQVALIPETRVREYIRDCRKRAEDERQDGLRMLRTVKERTSAEDRCFARSVVWDMCADQLEKVLAEITERGEPCRDSSST